MYKVSAIITTCKRPPEIVKRAIVSVLNQTYRNIEIIVVDDSPDSFIAREEVKHLVSELNMQSANHIQYIRHQKCLGACAARNTGLKYASGEVIGYLDDDDEWCKNKVEKMIGKFDDPKVGLVYCNHIRHNDTTGETKKQKTDEHDGDVFADLITHNFIGSTSFPLLRRQAIINAGAFDEKMLSVQDLDLWLRISKGNTFCYIDDYLITYHIHDGEQISTNLFKRFMGLKRINEKNREYLDTHPAAYYIRYSKLIPLYTKIGKKKKALSIWFQCVKREPYRIVNNMRYLGMILILRMDEQLIKSVSDYSSI